MPSDERVARVLELLQGAHHSFRSVLATTLEQLRSSLDRRRSAGNGTPTPVASELGTFAAGRIDPERFARLLAREPDLEQGALDRIERAYKVLGEVAARADELCVVDVPPGASLRDEVSRALAAIGRAYGAAHVVEQARTGGGEVDETWLSAYRFRQWNRAERQIAPPLVIHVDGADLRAEGLAEFCDGQLRLVLLVRGACAPAPLVRLVSPGVFVQQTTEVEDLARLARVSGPAVAALVPDGCARFVHDPEAGAHVWERVAITARPGTAPRGALGGRSAFQQNEELRQLEALAERPAAGGPGAPEAAGAGAPAPTDPIDKLAAWLLAQADAGGES